jgi:TonB family protein
MTTPRKVICDEGPFDDRIVIGWRGGGDTSEVYTWGAIRAVPLVAVMALVAVPMAPTAVSAQSIMGRVVDTASGLPLRSAAVGVQVPGDSVVKTLTAKDGVFALRLPAPGTYVVRVQASLARPVLSDSIVVAADSTVQREFRVPMPPDPVFYDFQVDKPVAQVPGRGGPRYPDELKREGVEGKVFVRFVVDTMGHAVTETFRVLRQTHAEFATAVRRALPQLRFVPAERQGRKVAQLVEQPFEFALGEPAILRDIREVGERTPPSPR